MSTGYYVYLEASGIPEGSVAVLDSPWFLSPRCVSFWYHSYGDDVGALYVRAVSNSGGAIRVFEIENVDCKILFVYIWYISLNALITTYHNSIFLVVLFIFSVCNLTSCPVS